MKLLLSLPKVKEQLFTGAIESEVTYNSPLFFHLFCILPTHFDSSFLHRRKIWKQIHWSVNLMISWSKGSIYYSHIDGEAPQLWSYEVNIDNISILIYLLACTGWQFYGIFCNILRRISGFIAVWSLAHSIDLASLTITMMNNIYLISFCIQTYPSDGWCSCL